MIQKMTSSTTVASEKEKNVVDLDAMITMIHEQALKYISEFVL